MKFILCLVLMATILTTTTSMVFAGENDILIADAKPDYRPELMTITPDAVFIPAGFDDNDEVQIVTWGELPSTCEKSGKAEATVSERERRIYVTNQIYHMDSSWCVFMPSSYTQPATLKRGELTEGKYEIFLQDENGEYVRNSQIQIAKSKTLNVDDHLYAPVDQLRVVMKKDGSAELVLTGTFESNCIKKDKVRFGPLKGNVIPILPIASWDASGKDCAMRKRHPFEMRQTLSREMVAHYRNRGEGASKGVALLHVRTLFGRAINHVVKF